MAIVDLHFEDGIFHTCVCGCFNKSDVMTWANALRRCLQQALKPVVLIDMTAVDFIPTSARMLIAEVMRTLPVRALVFATADNTLLQSARMIGILGEPGRTYAFASLEEARQFAQARAVAQPLISNRA
jgi:hypothetical protein